MEGILLSKRIKNYQTIPLIEQAQRAQQMASGINIKTVQTILLKR